MSALSGIFTRARLAGLAIALGIFALDQWVKKFVTQDLGVDQLGDVYPLISFFDLRYAENFGVSMGMFTAETMELRWILVGVTALIALGVFVWMMREKATGDILALSLVLGGALGNIMDRYSLGYVVDYADFHIGDWRPFFIFNLADAAITVGVVILLARSLLMGDKTKKEPAAQAAAET